MNILQSKGIHNSVKEDFSTRNEKTEDEVIFDHLDVRGWRKTVAHLKEKVKNVIFLNEVVMWRNKVVWFKVQVIRHTSTNTEQRQI